jgi:hypothetical protein
VQGAAECCSAPQRDKQAIVLRVRREVLLLHQRVRMRRQEKQRLVSL